MRSTQHSICSAYQLPAIMSFPKREPRVGNISGRMLGRRSTENCYPLDCARCAACGSCCITHISLGTLIMFAEFLNGWATGPSINCRSASSSLKGIYFCYQSLDKRRSAPGAADPKNLVVDDDCGKASTRWALRVLMAISSFFRGPNAVMLSSDKFSGVSDRNMSMSISLTTNVPFEGRIEL